MSDLEQSILNRDPTSDLPQDWDVIVVGTGVGGATLGHALARQGKRVLFCERGGARTRDAAMLGAYPEERSAGNSRSFVLQAAGRHSHALVDVTLARPRPFVPFIGAGAGGSSALFGMAMERFSESDFQPRRCHPDAVGSTLEDAWPVDYKTLSPYYAEAEALYRVRGTSDPLAAEHGMESALMPVHQLTPAGNALFRFLETRGMHPYRLPMACEFVQGCQFCQGFLCPRACKNDSMRMCLQPAIETFGAQLMDHCRVLRIEADRSRVTGLVCRWRGETLTLRAEVIVLAAGALHTPNLLLRSASASHWPQGLANRSGMVGRNLMRHLIDLYLIQPEKSVGNNGIPLENRFKELAFNDFYENGQDKLGSVQSFGRLPPAHMLFESMRHDLRNGPLPWLDRLMPVAAPVLSRVLNGLVGGRMALASLMEDLPYAHNRVLPPRDGEADQRDAPLRFTYTVGDYEEKRVALFRRRMKKVLDPLRWQLVKQAHNNERIAHACGTCRFGTHPATSVLDPNNRAHDLDNLYVVDSSFFPSSGGTNPSLTIAANALRVARHLAGR